MKKAVVMFVGAAALVMVTAVPAAAQTSELGISYSCQKWNSGFCASKGFAVDFGQVVHKAPNTALSIIGDLGWNRFTDEEDDTSFVGGVRERLFRNSRVSPYFQATAGIMHWAEKAPFSGSGNDFMVGGGGGVQIKLTEMFDVKAEMNFWGEHSDGDWDTITRLTFGGVIKFGKK